MSSPASVDPSALRQTYAAIIEDYLSGREEEALLDADEAGRRAVDVEDSLVVLVDAYHAALARAVASAGNARDGARVVQSAAVAIARSLASYEIALGGLRKTTRRFPPSEDDQKALRRIAQDRGHVLPDVEGQSDERTRIASAIHSDAVESLAAVATRLDLLARQLDDQDEAASIEKLREAVVTAHATTVILAGAHEEEREIAYVPAPIATRDAAIDAPTRKPALTQREREILSMISAGATNAEIADRLVISQSTVKSHVKNILRKLGVRNRTHAAARYFGS
jgi:DNA-binding CsgD family transcriptional regulator